METNSKLIWSADVDERELFKVLTKGVLPVGTIVKLDRLFFEQSAKSNIRSIQSMGYPVFVDAKIIEVPKKVLQIAETYLMHKPYMLNMMAGACNTGIMSASDINKVEVIKRFAELCDLHGTRSCVVTVLTSKAPDLVESEYCTREALPQVLWYVNLAYKCGITDIVCSPREVCEIRKHEDYDSLTLNTPGVRMVGTDVRDQARVTTPAQALLNGADKIVVGSNLTDGNGDIADRVKRNFEKLREHCIEEAGIDIADGIKCS